MVTESFPSTCCSSSTTCATSRTAVRFDPVDEEEANSEGPAAEEGAWEPSEDDLDGDGLLNDDDYCPVDAARLETSRREFTRRREALGRRLRDLYVHGRPGDLRTVLAERSKLLERLKRFQRSIKATRARPAGP